MGAELKENSIGDNQRTMPNYEERFPENEPGEFYVVDSCIGCSRCDELAPFSFRTLEEGGYNYVYHQPSTPEERDAAEEALEECPVEAIGRRGDP